MQTACARFPGLSSTWRANGLAVGVLPAPYSSRMAECAEIVGVARLLPPIICKRPLMGVTKVKV